MPKNDKEAEDTLPTIVTFRFYLKQKLLIAILISSTQSRTHLSLIRTGAPPFMCSNPDQKADNIFRDFYERPFPILCFIKYMYNMIVAERCQEIQFSF